MFSRIITCAGRNVLRGASGSQTVVCAPASMLKRFIATGDNSEVYIPSDAGFKEFNYDPMNIYHPPGRVETIEKIVESVEDMKWPMPLADMWCVKFGQSMPTIHDDKAPERDTVNFPRAGKDVAYPEGVRLLFIPDSWFRAMYPITGVTGPYFLSFGLLTFLLSKEWLVYEHEMHVGVHLALVIAIILKKYGPLVSRYLEGMTDYECFLWNKWQKESIEDLESIVESEKAAQHSLKNQGILFDAKRENVHLQREAEYRNRLMMVYQEVRRKLDYQIAAQEAGKQFAQRHMVSWILDNVNRGLGGVSEKETLTKCIADLKSLSVTRAGVI